MLKIDGISLKFAGFSIDDVSLDIGAGEYFIFFGPTGSGKTLLLEIIAGLRKPDAGSVKINGNDVTALDPAYRRIGYVPQDLALIPFKTVRQNIAFGLYSGAFMPGAGGAGREIKSRVDEMLSLLGINHLAERFPEHLSGGEKQRVALGRALVVRPEILLLDEPLSALDEKTGDALMRQIKALHGKFRTTTVHVCHRLDELFFMADRLAVLRGGRVVQAGSPRELYSGPEDIFVAELLGVRNILPGEVRLVGDKRVFFIDGLPVRETEAPEGPARAVMEDAGIGVHSKKPDHSAGDGILLERRVESPAAWRPDREVLLSGGSQLRLPAGSLPENVRSGDIVYVSISRSSVRVLREGARE